MSKIKKKYRRLEMAEKLKILSRLENGESVMKLATEYSVTHPTICGIKKNKDELEKYAALISDKDGSLCKKRMNHVENQPLDTALYTWFAQKRLLGEPVSGPILKTKAILINEKLRGPENFKASDGWLWRLKQRHGIRQLSVQGESLSSDVEAGQQLLRRFTGEMEEKGYDPENIYNADETGLQWKSLPDKTLASRSEQTAPGRKVLKDRVTIMLYANATGTHKLRILLIGKSKKPRCFKNVTNLPVIYKNQNSSWMDRQLFEEWFVECFIPQVQEKQQRMGRAGQVVLLVDNAPSHKISPECTAANSDFIIEFFPPNVTAIMQPMDQRVIEKVKRIYKKNVLTELFLGESAGSVVHLLKSFTLKDCCYLISDAWDTVTAENIRKAWKPLNIVTANEQDSAAQAITISETPKILHRIPGCEECDEDDTTVWLNSEKNDPDWQILTDDEIVALTAHEESGCQEVRDKRGDAGNDGKDGEDQISFETPSVRESLTAIKILSRWLENENHCDNTSWHEVQKIRAKIRTALEKNEGSK